MSLSSLRSRSLKKRRRAPQVKSWASLWRRRVQLEPLESRTMLTATVATEKDDYAPGETALISGSGFQIGETIELTVLHTDETPNTGPGHEPWYVVDGGEGDLDGVANGKFQTTW